MSLKRLAAAGLAAAVCFLAGCVEEPPYEDTSHDGRFVGSWQTIYEDDDGMGIEITILESSGNLIEGGFLKVDDFWIESWLNTGTWRVSNDTLYETVDGEELSLPYTIISGDRMSLVFCEKGACYENIAQKVDVAAVRRGLGTVYGQDLSLYAAAGYTDLMWRLEADEDEIIDFDIMYFYDGQRYFGADWFYDDYDGCYYPGEDVWDEWYDPVWYTVGSRLFLVLTDFFKVEEKVELNYEVAGVGSDARLSLVPVLPGGALGDADVWLPAEYDDWGWGSYKSKQGRKAAKSRKALLTKKREDVRRHVRNSSVYRR